jgi:acyl-CoA hydrolase
VTLSRADAPIIVTEYGCADLRRLDAVARAEALIAIAAPAARTSLRAHLNA